MAAFSTSSQILREKYDVFINFRGSDIRHGFLSHLIKHLRQEGIDVYVDERLEKGNEISSVLIEAIERSIIALVIFSKEYASSRWCLEELVKIMECKRVNRQIVIPVFYNVDPSHVRHQEGSFADAFAQHEQKFKDNSLQVWRSVLKETANLSGYHQSSNFHDESNLISGIVNDLLKKLEEEDTIQPRRQLIGFEENLAKIESFLKENSEEVGVIGIWGKGGAGKTTLARVVFDKISHQFDSSYFVSNVREESKKIGLACLLETIVSVLLNDENLTKKGRHNIQRRLLRSKVLLVLDDVDNSLQLQSFIEENFTFGPNSKVIITSRDRHVLVSGGVHVVYEVKELNIEESLQLFCWYAFKQVYPKVGYEKLSAQAIQYARGLPLALKVLGSYMCYRNTKTWESALKKLRKYPNVEIQNVLRVSYDGLDIPEKTIFLDIAFFFRGGNKEDIIRVLDACDDLYVDCGISRLLDKALITISRDNRVDIHDLLQQMAEEIVREESREHPEKRSRLKDAKEIHDLLNNSMGTCAIEGITLDPNELENDLYLSFYTFQKMSNLRFLTIKPPLINSGSPFKRNYTLHLPNGLDSLSSELRYFRWENYPLKSLPPVFSLKKLVELHMPWSKVVKLWNGVQDLMNLKIIDLNHCYKLKELPDFTMAKNLEIVDLQYCENLYSIHPSILSLPNLVSLDLSWCWRLKNLHRDYHLKSLKHLTLTGCMALEEFMLSSDEMTSLALLNTGIKTLNLPVGRFSKLKELRINWPPKGFQIIELSCLTSLKNFSISNFREEIDKSKLAILFDAWHSLEELHLRGCMVYEIPENIWVMSLLKILSLQECRVESLPNGINHLSKLKQIDLGECRRLKCLPELPPSITHLYVDECTSLETFNFKIMWAIYNNYSCEVKVCYPGIAIPKGFKYFQMGKSSITIEIAPASSCDHLLGFASCIILSPLKFTSLVSSSICRKFHFEYEKINYKDEKEFPLTRKWKTNNVFVWYDPMERILKGTQRRRYDEGATYKFACEFFIRDVFHSHCHKPRYDDLIKGCGIWPIYASELQNTVQQMELKPEKGSVTSNSSENPNAGVAPLQIA